MQALEDVFDSNRDGVLDTSDASWSSFRILVTNADGTTTLEALAQAGVTSIDLQANAYRQSLPDGSSIDGETSFTRSDGTTGTAAVVSFAASGDHVVQQSVTQNAAGATVVRNSTYTADGELAEQITTTTLADGLDRTTTYDWNGDGVIDQTETDDTVVNSDGSTTEAVIDTDGSGVVLDSTTTSMSADGLVVTSDRDTTGAGYTDQREVDTRLSTGGSSVSVSDLNRDGSLIDQTVSSVSGDGASRIVPFAGGTTWTRHQVIGPVDLARWREPRNDLMHPEPAAVDGGGACGAGWRGRRVGSALRRRIAQPALAT